MSLSGLILAGFHDVEHSEPQLHVLSTGRLTLRGYGVQTPSSAFPGSSGNFQGGGVVAENVAKINSTRAIFNNVK